MEFTPIFNIISQYDTDIVNLEIVDNKIVATTSTGVVFDIGLVSFSIDGEKLIVDNTFTN